jgi:hypothetical protein
VVSLEVVLFLMPKLPMPVQVIGNQWLGTNQSKGLQKSHSLGIITIIIILTKTMVVVTGILRITTP